MGVSTKVLIADKLAEHVESEIQALGCEVKSNPDLSASDLSENLGDSEILVVRSTKVTDKAISAATNLSLVIRAGAGVNTIDVESASKRGIQVANCPGTNAAAVAELAIGLMIAADRRIVDACQDLRKGKWRKKEYGKAQGLKGRTIGILGFGAIGQAVAKAAKGLEMEVIVWSRSMTKERAESMNVNLASSPIDLAAKADVVSVHLALCEETKHFVGKEFLDQMQTGAILINTSRGPLVDTNALKESIANKQLRFATDVFEEEPEGGENEFNETEFADLITCTPHIGASTTQTSNAVGDAVVEIVASYLKNGLVESAVNLLDKSSASHRLVVRHLNQVGVLAGVLDGLRSENINVEETENTIFNGEDAAVCSLRLDKAPSGNLMETLSSSDSILNISVAQES